MKKITLFFFSLFLSQAITSARPSLIVEDELLGRIIITEDIVLYTYKAGYVIIEDQILLLVGSTAEGDLAVDADGQKFLIVTK